MTVHTRLIRGIRRHLVVATAVAVVLTSSALAGGVMASAASKAAKPVPWPAAHTKVFLYVDTDAAAKEGIYGDCQQGSIFQRGQQILFRVSGTSGGVTLTTATVRVLNVIIPGVKAPLPLVFGAHTFGVKTGAAPPEYYVVPWTVPKNYPLGVVNFQVHVVSKTVGKFNTYWTQIPIVSSDLTIVKA